MADHYQVLGVARSATKEEIKAAFRKLAVKYHPDKHVHSSDHVRQNAALRFKQVSEAYDVLVDELKRASYNSTSDSGFHHRAAGGRTYSNPYGAHHGNGGYGSGYGYGYSSRDIHPSSWKSTFESVVRFMTTRAFLLNSTFAGALFVGFYAIGTSGDVLWKRQNSGKSFEEAMESINKAKALKDKT